MGAEQESEQGTATGDIATDNFPSHLPSILSDPPSDLLPSGSTLPVIFFPVVLPSQ